MAIEIYTKPNCVYCNKAKKILVENNVEFIEKDIKTNPELREELLQRFPDAKLVPQIFVEGELLGGYDELTKYWIPDLENF